MIVSACLVVVDGEFAIDKCWAGVEGVSRWALLDRLLGVEDIVGPRVCCRARCCCDCGSKVAGVAVLLVPV